MSSSGAIIATLALLAFALAYTSGVLFTKGKHPPGPSAYPFLGHTFQVPRIKTWRYLDELSKKYGPIFRLSLAGDDIVVLTKSEDVEELLGRRSHNYSSRKPLVYAGKYQSNNKRLLLLPYGENLKKQRAAFYQMLQPRVVGAYEVIQELESVKLLHDMLTRPTNAPRHCRRFSASLVFTLSYGKRLEDDDKDLNAILAVLEDFTKGTYPGAHLVDTFTILDRLPDFLAPWRTEAQRKHVNEVQLYSRLALEVKGKMDNGDIGLECFAARLWDQKEDMGLDIEELSYIAGSAFGAGTDTTGGTVMWFLLAMILYPNTMKKAQAELDAVLGTDGNVMPGFAHINDLPYCVALTKEIFRWAPAAPGGFPHYSDADDEYKGYKINRGTNVIPCIWSMHHDEDEFPDAFTFKPERFMRTGTFAEHDSLIDGHYGFGFGRRKCPGQYLGSKSIWIGLTRLLWGFNINPELDVNGVPIPVHPDNCTSGMTSRPVDFPVRISPRSENHAHTITKEWEIQNPHT